jgi:hypothetical protein
VLPPALPHWSRALSLRAVASSVVVAALSVVSLLSVVLCGRAMATTRLVWC